MFDLKQPNKKVHLIAVDMGYGHQRAAQPLRPLAHKKAIINANNYAGIPTADRTLWKQSRVAYEFMSKFKNFPLIGEPAWDIFDKFQAIEPFYPKRDLSAPTLQLRSTYALIKRKNWGRHLIEKLAAKPLPLVTTFFIPAFMAEIFDYPEEIYCLCTDSDVSRAWAPLKPTASRIRYFAPSRRVEERLKLYGVKPENIFVTGFPLPTELVGKNKTLLKKNLSRRLVNLDPEGKYLTDYHDTICHHLGCPRLPETIRPFTVTFAVGGAGAQREIGIKLVKALHDKLKSGRLRLNLIAGIHNDVHRFFKTELKNQGFSSLINKSVRLIFSSNKQDYFKKFNKILATTDILWTKPSELSFYTALGLPIIMSDPIGSQEKFNQKWLLAIGSGANQENPDYAGEWLFDWLNSGWFAEAAMQGFLEATAGGATNIAKIIAHRPTSALEDVRVHLQY